MDLEEQHSQMEMGRIMGEQLVELESKLALANEALTAKDTKIAELQKDNATLREERDKAVRLGDRLTEQLVACALVGDSTDVIGIEALEELRLRTRILAEIKAASRDGRLNAFTVDAIIADTRHAAQVERDRSNH